MTFAILLAAGLLPGGVEPLRLTVADEGKEVEARVGAEARLALPVIAGAGYLWQQAPPVPAAVEVRDEPSSGQSAKPGGTLDQVFRLIPKRAGRVTMRFALRRPWEKAVKPSGEFRVTLLIRP
jgi:inhibitor of cysteine peptidase